MQEIKIKIILIGAFVLAIIGVSALFFSNTDVLKADWRKQKTNCASFKSQEEAQRAYDRDSENYKQLDKDKDGEACQSYPYPKN